MTKLEFIAAFKSACDTLPTELVDAALADYERQFTDQFLSGASEQVIVERWGSPQHAALKLKLGTFNGNLKQTVSVQKVARVGISGVGLALMDILLCVPAVVYGCLLMAFYIAALAVYLTGIFVTSSSLAGVNYIDVPAHYLLRDMHFNGTTHLNLGNIDIVPTELIKDDEPENAGDKDVAPVVPEISDHTQHFLHDRGFHISTHVSKNTVWNGVMITASGMIFLLLCMLATRFTFTMLRQFIAWHLTVLKNA